MCIPMIAGLAIGALGVGMQAYAAKRQVEAQNDAAEYNAQLQERNAQIAEVQAKDAVDRGETEKANLQRRVRQLKGTQRTAFAGSGVLVDQGSAYDVLQDTTEQAEMDSLTIMHNANKEAWGHQVQAGNYTGQAGLSRSSKGSPGLAAGTTLLTGASQLGSRYFMNS